ncbi:MAG: hypothetical protein ACI8S6_001197 [Myxococcota bacterium]|jgi:uncharacterized protein YndB with AHSA1/START domain
MIGWRQSWQASADIDAPSEAVWSVLADIDTYGSWNTLSPSVGGRLEVGRLVWLRVRLGRWTLTSPERVQAIEPPSRLVWGLSSPRNPLLWAQRVQTIDPRQGGCTYETTDTIGGLLLPIVRALFDGALREGFEQMAVALKQHVESLAVRQLAAPLPLEEPPAAR